MASMKAGARSASPGGTSPPASSRAATLRQYSLTVSMYSMTGDYSAG